MEFLGHTQKCSGITLGDIEGAYVGDPEQNLG